MNYLIRYHERLGDIVRCLPIAKRLRDQGHQVFFECKPEYHSLFTLFDFAQPIAPNNLLEPHRTLDLQVWPRRFLDYQNSGKTWGDFVYSIYPESNGISERDVYGLLSTGLWQMESKSDWPDDTALICGWGFSQVDAQGRRQLPDPHKMIAEATKRQGIKRCAFLRPPGVDPKAFPEFMAWEAPDIPTLCQWIYLAPVVVTIDSAPNVLAAAVGRKEWIYFPSGMERNNFRHPRQKAVVWI